MNFSVKVKAALVILSVSLLTASAAYARWQRIAGSQEPSTLKVSVNLVSLHVTVTDAKGHMGSGLQTEDFKIYEDGVEQSTTFFSTDEAPVTWALALDRSGSMFEMIKDVYQAALHVMDEGTNADEMSIITFNHEIELVSDFTSDRRRLENAIVDLRATGQTALYDAIDLALEHIREGRRRKKVLVVVTDGEDNFSHIEFDRLVELVERNRDVVIYPVGMFEPGFWWERKRISPKIVSKLRTIAETTGASAHFPKNIKECRQAMTDIAREVSQHYSLGYYPSNRALDGKWRRIRVEIVPRAGKDRKYFARTRAGYYATDAELDSNAHRVPGGPQ